MTAQPGGGSLPGCTLPHLPAAPRLGVGVKRGEERGQVAHDVGDRDIDPVDECAAVKAEPLEAVPVLGPPSVLDDDSNRAILRPLRRVPQMYRQQEDFASADRHVVHAAGIVNFQDHVAAQLIEELLARVVVEIDPLVRSANDLHDHPGILENQFVADRRFQEMAVRVDPPCEVERPT
jgi:hypothetical protein